MRFVTDMPPPALVETPEEVERCLTHCLSVPLVGVDTETLGKGYSKMVDQVIVMGLSPDSDTRYLVRRHHLQHFAPLLADKKVAKAIHNYKFDAHRLANAGLPIDGPVFDSMVGDFLLDEDLRENRHGLKDCMYDYFDLPMGEYNELFGKEDARRLVPGHVLWDKYVDYASLDGWAHRELALYLMKKLSEVHMFPEDDFSLLDHYWDVEEDQLKCLWEMERRGITIDRERLQNLNDYLIKQFDGACKDLNRAVGYPLNPNSPKQIRELLFDSLNIAPYKRTNSGEPSTDEESLNQFAQLGIEEVHLILKCRKIKKLQGTYGEGLLKHIHTDGKIHTSYSPTKVTGRLGSAGPNLQNIPARTPEGSRIRSCFVADSEDEILLVGDYEQLEMRLLAHMANDGNMQDAINGGKDLHSFTASTFLGVPYAEFIRKKDEGDKKILDTRQGFKAVGFGIVYGIGPDKLGRDLSEKFGREGSADEAQGYINEYLDIFPGVGSFMNGCVHHAKTHGYVQTLEGRFRRLSKISSRRWGERGRAERQSYNAPIQGSAADVVKRAMIACWRDGELRGLGCTVRLQIHDELVLNAPRDYAEECLGITKDHMERPYYEPLAVPLDVSISAVENWRDGK